jgi:hypothetical protein
MKVLIPILLLLTMPVQAEVYKTITPDGEVIYSDVRTTGAKPINVPKPQTYTPAPLPVKVPTPEQLTEIGLYSSFVVESPQNNDTVRDNLGNVELLVTSEPELIAASGHRIEYYLDGKPHGRSTVDTRKVYTNVDRGKHTLSAAILDDRGEVIIRTVPVTVHLHRVSSQDPNSLTNPENPDSPLYRDPDDDTQAPNDRKTTIPLTTIPPLQPGKTIPPLNPAPVNRDTTIPLRTIPPLNRGN